MTVKFNDLGGHTRLTLHQAVFESATARDEHKWGWTTSLDRLGEFLVMRI